MSFLSAHFLLIFHIEIYAFDDLAVIHPYEFFACVAFLRDVVWKKVKLMGHRRIEFQILKPLHLMGRTRRPSSFSIVGNNRRGRKGTPRCERCRAWKQRGESLVRYNTHSVITRVGNNSWG